MKDKKTGKKLYRWEIALIQNYSYKNGTEQTPLEKPQTRVRFKAVAPGTEYLNDVVIRNQFTAFEIADEIVANKLGPYRWWHKLGRVHYAV